jgi:glycerol-3-phosphate acyltransferase PlsY
MHDWPPPAQAIAFGAAGYALGCVSGAYYLVRWRRGTDIRSIGSGNAGATNAGELFGPFAFLLVFAIDCAKGAAAVWLPRLVDAPPEVRAVAMLAVVAGHVWPAQLGFRGGKGIATAMGAAPVVFPWLALHLLVVAVGVLLLTRRVKPAGIAAVVAVPPLALHLEASTGVLAGYIATAVVVLWAHRDQWGRRWSSAAGAPAGDDASAASSAARTA